MARSKTRSNRVAAKLAVSLVAAVLCAVAFASAAQAAIGLSSFALSSSDQQAGKHADLSTAFDLSLTEPATPDENLKDLHIDLPPGVVGNAAALPHCDMSRVTTGFNSPEPACPLNTVVGMAILDIAFPGFEFWDPLPVLIYNITPYADEPAAFALSVQGIPVRLDTAVLPGDEYRVRVSVTRVHEELYILGGEVTFWGVPADHTGPGPFADTTTVRSFGGPNPQEPRQPFLANATSCAGAPQPVDATLESWQNQGVLVPAQTTLAPFTGCQKLPFEPSVSVNAATHRAGVLAGYDIDLRVPQTESPDGLATAHLKDATVTLPEGTALSPSLASGLTGCSSDQMQVGTALAAECPASSKIGDATVTSPLLPGPVQGAVYVGTPLPGNTYRILLALDGYGVEVKLEGKVTPDPVSGRLTATFANNPQLPFSKLHLSLKGGPNGALVNPPSCGTATTEYQLTAWSGAQFSGTDSFPVNEGCGPRGFGPKLSAGSADSVAGKSSPFLLRVSADEGRQNLSKISATLPEGLLAKLAGVPVCGDAAAASGQCPSSSQVGTSTVGVGAGPSPLYVPQPGKAPTGVYLAGPYKGAPYSLVVKVPAQAGPFDLGTVVVRNALRVDPTTTQVTAESDPLPQILEGIPIAYRDVRVEINRGDFTVNPTNCEPTQVTSTLTSVTGQSASPSVRFQVADCEHLAFKPTLGLSLKGQTRRTGNPAIKAVLTQPAGENANIARTQVILPKTMFIDQSHVNNPCTRVQFAANACPENSILGTATAWSPLLDQPLTGPVYFRSNGGERQLPDLVADLNGQIHVTLVGFIDSVKVGKETSRVRARFLSVPDAPVSRFVLQLRGGKRGLIENSQNLCQAKPVAAVQLEGQNGKSTDFQQKMATVCRKGKKGKRS